MRDKHRGFGSGEKDDCWYNKRMMKAFYAGSFDPFTNGHLQVVKQAARVFDEVIIGIGVNEEKAAGEGNEGRRVPTKLMRTTIEKVLAREGLTNVKVESYQGLTVKEAERKAADFLIRGIRNGMDYDYEENLAMINQNVAGIETIYFRAGETAHVSSSAVMQLWQAGVNIKAWVPKEVEEMLAKMRAGSY